MKVHAPDWLACYANAKHNNPLKPLTHHTTPQCVYSDSAVGFRVRVKDKFDCELDGSFLINKIASHQCFGVARVAICEWSQLVYFFGQGDAVSGV